MNHEDGADEDRKDQSVATITKKSSEGKEIYGKLYGARGGRVENAIENNDESENAVAVDFRSHLFFQHLPVHCVLHFLSFSRSLCFHLPLNNISRRHPVSQRTLVVNIPLFII